MNIPEGLKPVQAINPKTTNGAIAGDIVTLKNAHKCWIELDFTQAAGHATLISVFQMTDVAGTGSKVITDTVPIWANEDTAASDTLVRQTDAVNYTLAADIKNKKVIIQIDPATLDLAGGFDCIQVKTAASSEVTNFVSANYHLDGRYKQATPPSAIVD